MNTGDSSGRSRAKDLADIASVIHVVTIGPDTNNVIGCSDILAGASAQSDIGSAGGVVKERLNTAGRVGLASGVPIKRLLTIGRVG